MINRAMVAVFSALLATAAVAPAQPADPLAAMQKLKFLTGSWACTIQGGPSSGLVENIEYSFSPDGLWMTEFSQDTRGGDWATQMWGYDARAKKLVAVQFVGAGVFTKSVDGWVGGAFVSHRDDNGAKVSLRPVDATNMEWIITSADGSYSVKEACVRR